MKIHNIIEGKSENRELWDRIKSKGVVPSIDKEKYQARDGLEGPFRLRNGKVVYYDPQEGSYYDPDTDMYISYDDYKKMDEQIDETPKSPAQLIKYKIKKAEANAKARDPHTKIERDEARVARMLAARQAMKEEEVEQGVAEGSGFDQEAGIGIDGKSFKFKIRDLVALADNYPVTKIDPQQFSKQIAGRDEDSTQSMARAEKADLQYPIIVVKRQNGQLWIADGTHRAHKAIMHKLPSINAKIIPIKDMAPFDVDQGVAEGDKRPKYVVTTKDKPKKIKPSMGGESPHPYQGKLVGATEAEVSNTDYEFTHGKKPGGQGSWFFVAHRGGINFSKDVEGEDYIQLNQMSYSDAKKAAVKWARSKGHTSLFVAT